MLRGFFVSGKGEKYVQQPALCHKGHNKHRAARDADNSLGLYRQHENRAQRLSASFQTRCKRQQSAGHAHQEEPDYERTFTFPTDEPITAKIFVIDDETHSTMLLAEEY